VRERERERGREREGGRERGGERERESERERERECVCVRERQTERERERGTHREGEREREKERKDTHTTCLSSSLIRQCNTLSIPCTSHFKKEMLLPTTCLTPEPQTPNP